MAQKRDYLADLLGFSKRTSSKKNSGRGLFSSDTDDSWTRRNESLAQAEEHFQDEQNESEDDDSRSEQDDERDDEQSEDAE